MVMVGLIDRVRYPDEHLFGFDDRIPYDDISEGLRFSVETAKGQLAIDSQETLAELERRWAARQRENAPDRVTA